MILNQSYGEAFLSTYSLIRKAYLLCEIGATDEGFGDAFFGFEERIIVNSPSSVRKATLSQKL